MNADRFVGLLLIGAWLGYCLYQGAARIKRARVLRVKRARILLYGPDCPCRVCRDIYSEQP
jgi:hypothetical protein